MAGGSGGDERKVAKERGLKPVGASCPGLWREWIRASWGLGRTVVAEGTEAGGLTLEQMDRVEVNEAFAAQYLAVEKCWAES